MRRAVFLAVLATVSLSSPARTAPPAPEDLAHFETRIRPVLVEKCISCHGPKMQRGGLRLDSRAAILKGGDTSPAIVSGQPDKSLLIQAIRKGGDLKMPPKETLPPATVAAFANWIQAGAPWPDGSASTAVTSSVSEARKSHWAFKAVQHPEVPAVKKADWPRTPVDHFILARLENKGLAPALEVDRRTYIRRASFDLVGLPPTPQQIDDFVKDSSPDAHEKLLDHLLASPAYGERWARHWLDVARYADTKGYVFTEERRYPYAYTYRDYVVRAFNDDLPYDRFLLEQLAADKLDLGSDSRPLAAMGFLTLGRRFLNNIHDIIDDRIDTTMRGLQGLTVACARCHDHKFDPISTRDYYSIYGVFAGSIEPRELPLLAQPEASAALAAFNQELKNREVKLNEQLTATRAEVSAALRARTADYLLATSASSSPPGKDDLLPVALTRWRTHLAEARKSNHPVLAPWFALAAIPAADFATKGPSLTKQLAAAKDPAKPIDPLIAEALADKPLTTLAQVAALYGQLLSEADRKPTAANEALRKALGEPAEVPVEELNRYLNTALRNKLTDLRKRVEQWKASNPAAPPRAMVLNDAPNPFNPRVFVRGNPNNQGVAVPRQYLEVVAGETRKPFTKGSGRLELAQAIANKDNPLTARVLVNRVWMLHFGQGIVRTPGNFGLRGEPPTHPELLDWLAGNFMENGWSIKKLHKQIMLSAAYRQTSADYPRDAAIDPENTLVWKVNRRRLEFEALRDSLLAVSGKLDSAMGGSPVDITVAPFPPRRSIYGFIDRQNLPGLFRTFDLASPDSSTPQRHNTTVPQQALFLMNGPFVLAQARAFVQRPEIANQKTDSGRIEQMYRLAYGRAPDEAELALGVEFVRGTEVKGENRAQLTAWEQYAQVLLLGNEFAFVD